MNEKHQEINTLKDFANLADNEISIWQLLVGIKVIALINISRNKELIGKVAAIKINKSIVDVNIVFHDSNRTTVWNCTKESFISNFEIMSSISFEKDKIIFYLNKLLESYNFEEADNVYEFLCKNYISTEKYFAHRKEFLDKRRDELLNDIQALLGLRGLMYNEAQR